MWQCLIDLFELNFDCLNMNSIVWTKKQVIFTVMALKNPKQFFLKNTNFTSPYKYPIWFELISHHFHHIFTIFFTLLHSTSCRTTIGVLNCKHGLIFWTSRFHKLLSLPTSSVKPRRSIVGPVPHQHHALGLSFNHLQLNRSISPISVSIVLSRLIERPWDLLKMILTLPPKMRQRYREDNE
jgi:hypothetical protein